MDLSDKIMELSAVLRPSKKEAAALLFGITGVTLDMASTYLAVNPAMEFSEDIRNLMEQVGIWPALAFFYVAQSALLAGIFSAGKILAHYSRKMGRDYFPPFTAEISNTLLVYGIPTIYGLSRFYAAVHNFSLLR